MSYKHLSITERELMVIHLTALGVEFYFPLPHQPRQRGTDENTNGLLREYFPKGYDFNTITDKRYKLWLTNSITVPENVWVTEHLQKYIFLVCCTWLDYSVVQRPALKAGEQLVEPSRCRNVVITH